MTKAVAPPRGERSHRARLLVSTVAAVSLVVSGFTALWGPGIDAAEAVEPFPIVDDGAGTPGEFDDAWERIVTGDGNTGGTYTSDGWLRLTDNGTLRTTNLLNPVAFPSSSGFEATFDFRAGSGATIGDGLALYLVDGAEPISAGNPGAGLGYARNNSSACGTNGGYLGLGFDMFGNWPRANVNNFGGDSALVGQQNIGLRGSGPGDCTGSANTQYPWIDGVAVPGLSTAVAASGDPAADDGSLYRRASIVVLPVDGSIQVTVSLSEPTAKSESAGELTEVFSTELADVPGQVPLPDTLKLGFSASTGNGSSFHDIRNISVRSLGDLALTSALSPTTPGQAGFPAGTFFPGDPISFDLTATNNGPTIVGGSDPETGVAVVHQDLSDLPISDVTWTCVGVDGGECAQASGIGPVVEADWSGPAGGSVEVTVNGTVAPQPGSFTSTSVIPTNFDDLTVDPSTPSVQRDGSLADVDLHNNTAATPFDVVMLADAETSTIAADPETVQADGVSTSTITVTLFDEDGNPLPVGGDSVTISTTAGTLSDVTDNGDGTYTATLTAPTEADTATVSFTVNDEPASATATVTFTAVADLEVVKTLDTSPLVAGGPVSYTLTVTNNGPGAAEDFTVYDPVPGSLSDVQAETTSGSCLVTASVNCEGGPLANGESAEITITGVLSPDAPAGSAVVNTAQVESATTDPDQSNNTSTATGTVSTSADVSVEKSFAPGEPVAGEEVVYTLTATNSGPSTAQSVDITDPLDPSTTFVSAESDAGSCDFDGSVVSCAVGSLAPGATVTVTVTVTLAADAAAAVQNTAMVTTSTSDANDADNASSTSFEPTIIADLAATKSASASTVTAGDEFTYTVGVENLGPSAAQNAVLTDTVPEGMTVQDVVAPADAACSFDAEAVRCDWEALQPGETASIDILVLVAPDAPAGELINSASVASPADDADTANNSGSATVVVEQSADIGVEKTATPNPGVPGTEQSFTITVTNDGPSTARGVTVSDVLPSELRDVTADDSCMITGLVGTCALGDLAPGASAAVTVTGTIAPDATGSIANTANVASGTPDPNGDNYADTVVVPLEPLADVSLTKMTSTPDVALDGEVQYLVTVRNDGPSTATGVVVEDTIEEGIALTGAEASTGTWAGGTWNVGALQPGEEAEIAISGVAVAEGTFTNTATASSETPDPDADDLVDTADVTVTARADLAITKSISVDPAPMNGEVTYTLAVDNLGPNDATEVVVADEVPAELIGVAPSSEECVIADGVVSCELAELADGESAEFAFTGTVDPSTPSNEITNTATVAASQADPEEGNNSSTVVTPISGEAGIELTKTASQPVDTNGDGMIGAGDTVAYSFTVTNTGKATLTDAAIEDPLLGGPVECAALAGAIAPGESVECGPVSYTLTQADVDDGQVVNTAAASAESPRGSVADDDTATVSVSGASAVALEKHAGDPTDADGDGVLGAGDTVDYALIVSNPGTTTLTNAEIRDEMLGGALDCPALTDVSLAPGESAECGPITYTLTQADVEDGAVRNVASVTASAPTASVTDKAEATTTITGTSGVELTKTAGEPVDVDGDDRVGAGDAIEYRFTVRNSGTTVLSEVVLEDELLGGVVDCPEIGGVDLAPGDEVSCGPVSYTLTQDDVDAGAVHNAASVTAVGDEAAVSDVASVDVALLGEGGISLAKSAAAVEDANGNGATDAGDTIDYTFAVTNTGTTTATALAISDPRLDDTITCEAASIAPGEMILCGPAAYVLTQADVDAGEVVNRATASAVGAGGEELTAEASVTTQVEAQPAVALEKTGGDYADANDDAQVSAGDTVQFRFTVTNTGAATLTDAVLEDPKLGGTVSCEIPELAPGESVTCGPVSYTITADEARAHAVTNAATVMAISGASTVSASDSVTVDLPELAATGGMVAGLGWAILLIALGLLGLLIARTRRTQSA
ncbi:invasin domain 3-containing protein [Microbacterium sp. G2-8]|uniref:DUF7507 domain-containing protein n=1 Tax=Microbacterium sp. G2-8 TaxID=2842454 RepID=UPI001C89E4EC|nr:invasin domain 3-containing protein [Microbacterium sp. G2-8]